MANYQHGVYGSEVPTSVKPPVTADAAIPFIVGAAPVNMTDPKNVNKVGFYLTYDEAVAACGYVPAKQKAGGKSKVFEYGISEFIDSHFKLHAVSPVLIVNVLDPAKHKATATTSEVTLDAKTGSVTIEETGILPESVTLGSYVRGTDYICTFDIAGNLIISSMTDTNGDFKCDVGTSVTFTADKLNPAAVTAEDIIGGVDVNGNRSGFELIEEAFPRYRVVPGTLLAPGFSGDATVAAVMSAKTEGINGHFKAISLHDIPTSTVKKYQDAPAWKNENNLVDPQQVLCYPKLRLDDVDYHMSTQLAGLLAKVDADRGGNVPYVSPSNKNFEMTATVREDGEEIVIPMDGANYLNGEGIVTAQNFIGGWKCWGNRTACYPANTDVKDAFIPTRRMFNWINNTLITSYWSNIDDPMNRRLVDTVVDSANDWLNSLRDAEQIYGARVEFLESENPVVNLMDGKMKFHLYIGAEVPARSIEFVMEYDVSYFNTLFN